MCPREELFQRDEIAQALAHLLAIDCYHVVVHPVAHHLVALASNGLCYFALMVREYQVHSTAVNVEMVAEVFPSHGGAFAVPPRKSFAPMAGPAHNVFRLSGFPEGEIHLVVLL